jgi:hypothetical protein
VSAGPDGIEDRANLDRRGHFLDEQKIIMRKRIMRPGIIFKSRRDSGSDRPGLNLHEGLQDNFELTTKVSMRRCTGGAKNHRLPQNRALEMGSVRVL